MGDLRDWSPEPNGAVLEERPPSCLLPLPSSPSSVFSTNQTGIPPNTGSELRRRRRGGSLEVGIGCEVFPFGSVPLKTYLPDGDIDLTALVV
ncbi:hypothetical protein M0R45_028829 [Rubus argutus]|uniref:Uncharacterized protein n=1 Tax=Rubus argutus TaxID=59490 RepID=A0AAW1W8I6_RUBAR